MVPIDKAIRLFLSFAMLAISSYSFADLGFRDLKIGTKQSDTKNHCKPIGDNLQKCYGIDDLKFRLQFSVASDYCEKRKKELTEYLSFQAPKYQNIVDQLHGDQSVEIDFYFNSLRSNEETYDLYVYLSGFWYYKPYYWCPESKITIKPSEGLERYLNKDWFDSEPHDGIALTLWKLDIDFGPLYQQSWESFITNPDNPFVKLKSSLDNRYKADWEFTERDLELFNKGEREKLWISYEQGKMFIEIGRTDRRELNLHLTYHTTFEGQKLTEERKPRNVKFDEF